MIKCIFCEKTFEENEEDIFNHVEQCHLDAQANTSADYPDNLENSNEEDEEILALPNVKNYQAQDDISCIQVSHPEVNMVVNTLNIPQGFVVKDSVTGKVVI